MMLRSGDMVLSSTYGHVGRGVGAAWQILRLSGSGSCTLAIHDLGLLPTWTKHVIKGQQTRVSKVRPLGVPGLQAYMCVPYVYILTLSVQYGTYV